MFLTRISVGQPVFATMVMVAILVIGLFSYTRLPIEQLPDVDFPVVAVVTAYPGATPEAVESDIIEPIEDAVSTLAGIDSIQSTAQTGSSLVLMIFDLEVNSSAAAQDVLVRNSGMRSVVLDSRFVITGISRRNDGRVISARLAGYAIGSDHYNKPATFGELRFDGKGAD